MEFYGALRRPAESCRARHSLAAQDSAAGRLVGQDANVASSSAVARIERLQIEGLGALDATAGRPAGQDANVVSSPAWDPWMLQLAG